MSERVFWSVMVPTYRPDEGLLRQTLESVLTQDQGPERMEIVVVDDASPGMDVAALVDRLGGGRVRCEVQTVNRGLAGNWNRCIELARGEWIHLLHQDDLVRPGFYSKLGELIVEYPGVAACFCRHEFIRPDGSRKSVSDLERETPGVLQDFVERIFVMQRIQCPSVVVAADTYRRVGLFRTDMPYALDWDMWKRIAASGPIAFTPELLAAYREHDASETVRLRDRGLTYDDMFRSVDVARGYLPEPKATRLWRLARRRVQRYEVANRWRSFARGESRSPKAFGLLCLRGLAWLSATLGDKVAALRC